MIVYRTDERARDSAMFTVRVAPGKFHPNTDWLDENRKPITFEVDFKWGRAEVPDNLGQWMLDNGQAVRSPIILPPGVKL